MGDAPRQAGPLPAADLVTSLASPIRAGGNTIWAERPTRDDLDSLCRDGAVEEVARGLAEAVAQRLGPDHGLPLPDLGELRGRGDRVGCAFRALRPEFAPPLGTRTEGVLFSGLVLPAFGLFTDVDDATRSSWEDRVVVHEHRDPTEFVLELATGGDARIVIARRGRAETLADAVEAVTTRATRPTSLWRRLTKATRFRMTDVLKIPPLDFVATTWGDDRAAYLGVRLRLDGGAAPPVPHGELTLGRGETYDRHFVCDGPFLVVLLSGSKPEPRLAAWIEAPELLLSPRFVRAQA